MSHQLFYKLPASELWSQSCTETSISKRSARFLNPNHQEMSAAASEELNYRPIDTFFFSSSISSHQQIVNNSQPTAAFKRKTLQKDEFVLTIPAHSIMDKQLFFSPPFFSGKEDFPLFTYSKEAAPVRSRATQKSFRSLFAAIVGIGAAAGMKRKKKKGARLSWRGRKERLSFPWNF